jgi:RNA polymerase sigma-70 factor (ECF subfamily)
MNDVHDVEEEMERCMVMNESPSDQDLIAACQQGDRDAFHQLFETYKDRVYSIAYYFFNGDDASAKDITQQVFLKLFTRVEQFRHESDFATWLHRLVVNACLDEQRKRQRWISFGETEAATMVERRSQEDRYIRREMAGSVQAAIAGLKPKLRMAVLLKYFEELSYDEMAVVLGCSMGTVASRLNRAHTILARKLAHWRSTFMTGE